MTYEERVKNSKKIDSVEISYEDVVDINEEDFKGIIIEKMSILFAKKLDVEILNKFAKLSKRKRNKIQRWIGRIK